MLSISAYAPARRIILLVAAFVILGAGTGLAYTLLSQQSGSHETWPAFTEPESLVRSSDAIVVAHFVDQKSYDIPQRSAADGRITGSVTEILRRFETVEVLKGDLRAGDFLPVVTSSGYVYEQLDDQPTRDVQYEVAPVAQGRRYVLFLDKRSLPAGYPVEMGATIWVRPGEPGVAELSGERLTFAFSQRYRDSDSGTGFSLTRGELVALIATEGSGK